VVQKSTINTINTSPLSEYFFIIFQIRGANIRKKTEFFEKNIVGFKKSCNFAVAFNGVP
jgi:hypothetical protein